MLPHLRVPTQPAALPVPEHQRGRQDRCRREPGRDQPDDDGEPHQLHVTRDQREQARRRGSRAAELRLELAGGLGQRLEGRLVLHRRDARRPQRDLAGPGPAGPRRSAAASARRARSAPARAPAARGTARRPARTSARGRPTRPIPCRRRPPRAPARPPRSWPARTRPAAARARRRAAGARPPDPRRRTAAGARCPDGEEPHRGTRTRIMRHPQGMRRWAARDARGLLRPGESALNVAGGSPGFQPFSQRSLSPTRAPRPGARPAAPRRRPRPGAGRTAPA